MIFKWFDSKDTDKFGTELAQFFIQRMPLDSDKSSKKFAAKTQDILSKMELQIIQFKSKFKLNIYTKAKLANRFKWTLKDAGFNMAYVDELTEWLVKRL